MYLGHWLNPVDYKIWGVMQQRVYEIRINNLDELKQRLELTAEKHC